VRLSREELGAAKQTKGLKRKKRGKIRTYSGGRLGSKTEKEAKSRCNKLRPKERGKTVSNRVRESKEELRDPIR